MHSAASGSSHSNLVFVHGGGVGPWMWERQAAYFSREFSVHTPTLPGHELLRRSQFSTHVEAADAVAREIGLRDLAHPVTVVGFSLGGQTAIQLAASYPDHVERLVVVSSLVGRWRGARAVGLVAAAAAPLSKSRAFARVQAKQLLIPDERFDDYYALSRAMSAKTLSCLMQANLSFTVPVAVLRSQRPVLLMAGGNEERRLLRGMDKLHAELKTSSFEIFPGAGHGLPFVQPDQFNELLYSWLSATSTARRVCCT